jgi:MFS family permease
MTDSTVDSTTEPADPTRVRADDGPVGRSPRRPLRMQRVRRRRASPGTGRSLIRRPPRPTRRALPHLVLTILLAAQAVYLLYLARDMWFVWGDDYDFFLLRGTIPGVDEGLWAPHDDHWMTAVVLIDRLLFSLVGLHTYLPYVAVSIGLHLGCVLVTYLLLLRLGARPWLSVAASVVGLFAGIGAQAVLWNTTTGLIGALFCGLLAAYLLERRPDTFRGRLPAVVVLVVGLTFSGTGVVAVFFVAVFTLVRRRLRSAFAVVILPAAVFVAWYAAYGHTGAKAPLADRWDYLGVAKYVWVGLTSCLEGASGIDGAGPVLLLAVLAVVLGAPARVPSGLRALALAGLCAALAQLTLAAVSRPSFGEEAFTGGRYAYLTLMFLVPALAVALTILVPLVTAPRIVAAGLALFLLAAYVANAADLFHEEQKDRVFVSQNWPGLMQGIRAAAQDAEPVLTRGPALPNDVHGRFRADLAAREEFWDAIPPGEPSADDRLEAESIFFTGVATEAFGVGSGDEVRPALGFSSTRPVESGCRTITATANVATLALDTGSDGAQFGISGPTGVLVTHLVRDGEESSERAWPITPGRGFWVATSAQDAELVVNVSGAGDYEVCKF